MIVRNLRKLEWPTLIAELVLIFVGITSALWFDNWQASLEERALERELLVELHLALQADTADLNGNLAQSAATRASVDTVFAYLDERRPYQADLDAHFGQATLFTNFIRNVAAWEQLKAAGVSVIEDVDLRRTIIEYYEQNGELLHQVETVFVNRHFEGILNPVMADRFWYRGILEPATPRDYEALWEDELYRSSLVTHIAWMNWKDDLTRRVRGQAEDLITRIEESQ